MRNSTNTLIDWIRALDNRTKAIIIGLSLIFIILVSLSIGSFVIANRVDNNAKNVAKIEARDFTTIRQQAYGNCYRLQTLRDQVNTNSFTIYTVLKGSALFYWHMANDKSIELSDQDREIRKDIAKKYADRANKTTYIPKTDCNKAVNHPLSYIAPKEVHFSRVVLK